MTINRGKWRLPTLTLSLMLMATPSLAAEPEVLGADDIEPGVLIQLRASTLPNLSDQVLDKDFIIDDVMIVETVLPEAWLEDHGIPAFMLVGVWKPGRKSCAGFVGNKVFRHVVSIVAGRSKEVANDTALNKALQASKSGVVAYMDDRHPVGTDAKIEDVIGFFRRHEGELQFRANPHFALCTPRGGPRLTKPIRAALANELNRHPIAPLAAK